MAKVAKLKPQRTELEELAIDFIGCKAEEKAAQERRIKVEARILEIVGVELEGKRSVEAGEFKVSTTGKLNRAVDLDGLLEIAKELPTQILDRLVRHKPEINLTELRFVEENEPDTFKLFAKCFTTKPAKPSVSVEVKK